MTDGFVSRPLHAPQMPDPAPRQPVPPRARRTGPPGGRLRRLKPVWVWLMSGSVKRRLLRLAAIGIAAGAVYFAWLLLTLPNISDPRTLIAAQSSVITDRNGVELYRLFGEEDRTYVSIEDIPDSLEKAVVAIEDERFYDRGCMDFRALIRVAINFGQSGGGSTITRQLARNALQLNQENLINRKLKELILGCTLEWQYDKEALLELYLNWIPYGQNAYGAEQASQRYFGIGVKDLTLAQSAVLASLPQRPSYFSPYGKHVRTDVTPEVLEGIASGRITDAGDLKDGDTTIGLLGRWAGTGALRIYVGGRTDQVLRKMEDIGFIEESERLAALKEAETITFQPAREDIRAAHFVLWIRSLVEEMLGGEGNDMLAQGGLTIQTTLDWDMQQAADAVFEKHREDMADRIGANNMALIALDPDTREILAYEGNANYADEESDGKVDMVRAARQPGSSFKPIVYAAAFEKGYSPATVLYDVQTRVGDDEPQNFDGRFWGLMSARLALAGSRNIPAAKAFFLAGGEESVLDMAERLGATSPKRLREQYRTGSGSDFDYGWPLALGSAETPLLEMANAYATLGGGGVYRDTFALLSIRDSRGNLVSCPICRESGTELPAAEPVLDPRVAYQITSVLSDVSARPNEYWQQVLSIPGYAAAAKTGTSNECVEQNPKGGCLVRRPLDLWTIGYTPDLVTGVWVGNANSESLYEKSEALSAAAPIWKDFMIRAQKLIENPKTTFPMPEGMVELQVSGLSGQLPTECTPVDWRRTEIFLESEVPTEADPSCARLTVDKVTGLLASPACPTEAQGEESFLVPRSVAADRWPLWQAGIDAWAAKEMEKWNANDTHSGSTLPLPVAPTKECDPSLTPGRLIQPEVSIEFPGSGDEASYPSFVPKVNIDVGSSIREIRYTVDDKPVGSATEAPFKVTARVPRSISKDGNHVLEVTVIDEYYNQATDSVTFSFGEDTGGPSVELTAPDSGMEFAKADMLRIAADADDSQGGIKYVEFFLDDTLLTTRTVEPYAVEYPLKDVTPGSHVIRAVATDLAGNKAEDERSVMVK